MVYKLQYKCRKCGKVTTEGSAPEFLDIDKIVQSVPDPKNNMFRLIGLHRCEDDSWGVTDFIGAEQYTYGQEGQS